MGDRIEELPVDQIILSKDEKQILDSMFVPSTPIPTKITKSSSDAVVRDDDTPPDTLANHYPPVANPLQTEIRTAFVLAVLFCVCSLPQVESTLGTMIPFLGRSTISCLAARGVLFMMMAYVMLNWHFLTISKNHA